MAEATITATTIRALFIEARRAGWYESPTAVVGAELLEVVALLVDFPGWAVQARFELTEPAALVSVEVVRLDYSTQPGLSSAEVEPGRMQAAMFDAVRIGDLVNLANLYRSLGAFTGGDGSAVELTPRPGRPPVYSDREVARCAARYVKAAEVSRRPKVDVAARYYSGDEAIVSEHLRRASKRGFYLSRGAGITGGTMTPKGLQVLTPKARRGQ